MPTISEIDRLLCRFYIAAILRKRTALEPAADDNVKNNIDTIQRKLSEQMAGCWRRGLSRNSLKSRGKGTLVRIAI